MGQALRAIGTQLKVISLVSMLSQFEGLCNFIRLVRLILGFGDLLDEEMNLTSSDFSQNSTPYSEGL